jgi:hypothetical protein
VNAKLLGGTAQTGRDVGLNVLITPGTATGQLDVTSGVVKSNLVQILGTLLTETAGLLAGGFKKLFNVASPTGTLNSIPDAVPAAVGGLALVDAAGAVKLQSGTGANQISLASGLVTLATSQPGVTIPTVTDVTNGATSSALTTAQADLTTLIARITALRAGYLDNLNVGGLVASSVEATAIQNNTRVVRVVPTIIERPDAGTVTYRIELLLYDTVGNMEVPDSAPTITLVNQSETDLSARLDSVTMALVSTGRYKAVYTASVGDAIEQLIWAFSVVEGGVTRIYGNTSLIVDTTAVDFTAADRAKLDSLHDVKITTARANALDFLTGAVALDSTVAKEATVSAGFAAVAASVWNAATSGMGTLGSLGKKLADWVLGSDSKVLLSADAQTGVTIPTVASVTLVAANGINAASIATNAIDADAIADGAINAAAFAGGAINENVLGTGAVDEIVDAVYEEARSGHTTPGTYGEGVAVVDKTGFSLSTAGILAIWHQATAAIITASTIGKKLVDWVLGTDKKVLLSTDAQTGVTIPTVTSVGTVAGNVNGDVAGNVAGNVVGSVGSVAMNGITAASLATLAVDKIVDAALDEILPGAHDTPNSAGKMIQDAAAGGGGGGATVAEIWAAQRATNDVPGSMGETMNDLTDHVQDVQVEGS